MPLLLDDLRENTLEVDDLFLLKVRVLINRETQEEDFNAVHIAYMVLGTLILIPCWAMLNAVGASTLTMGLASTRHASELGFMNTFISAAPSGLICFGLKRWAIRENKRIHRYDVKSLANGMIAGMAAISASAGVVLPWAAIICGVLTGGGYLLISFILNKIKVDDPMESL